MGRTACIAMILAGGEGHRMGALTSQCAKPAIPFGGRFRLIDFVLSNCINSRIDTVAVLTQYHANMLHEYIGTGAAWTGTGASAARAGGDRRGCITLLPPPLDNGSTSEYRGTADAVYQNIRFIQDADPEHVLILSADQLYQMDYGIFLAAHRKHEAELSIAVTPVAPQEANRMGMVFSDKKGRIMGFAEKPANSFGGLASMGVYLFRTDVLLAALEEDVQSLGSHRDFGRDIIPRLLARKRRVFAYEFHGYWRDVGTIPAYYEASMQLLDLKGIFDMDNPFLLIRGNTDTQGAPQVLPSAHVSDALLANGCIIQGTVRHSIVSQGARVESDALVEDTVLMPGAVVASGAHVVRAIIGENAVVEPGAHIGSADAEDDIAVVGNAGGGAGAGGAGAGGGVASASCERPMVNA